MDSGCVVTMSVVGWERRGDSVISEVLTMTPLFVIEEPGEWRIEVYDDGSVRYVDFFEDISEIMFGVEL
ncbi:MAG: hypothetical protein QW680_12000 [Pyrobaculum sp.]